MPAAPVAAAAGLVSFLAPRCLPLFPGHLSFVTGLSGADLAGEQTYPPDAPPAGTAARPGGALLTVPPVVRERTGRRAAPRGRVLLGSVLFVFGFSAVFVSEGALFGPSALAFLRSHHVPYPSIYDEPGALLLRLAGLAPQSPPTTFLLDRRGRVAARFGGGVTREQLLGPVRLVATEAT